MKPRLAVFKLASCDGCQLQLLNALDQLLALAEQTDIAFFPEASSRMRPGPYDLALVEGSVATPGDARRIIELRAASRCLVTMGACATAGGIQALRNWAEIDEYRRLVYPSPEFVSCLSRSTPVAEHVRVDVEIWGCPVDDTQLLGVLRSLLSGTVPSLPAHSVCMECKRREAVCVVVSRGEPCLGPVTRAGCGAVCPRMSRGCYGCFGPADDPNLPSFCGLLLDLGLTPAAATQRLRGINGYVQPWREAGERLAGGDAGDDPVGRAGGGS